MNVLVLPKSLMKRVVLIKFFINNLYSYFAVIFLEVDFPAVLLSILKMKASMLV